MRIRIDISEMQSMAEALQAGASALAEVGVDVCSCDLPREVAAMFEQHRAPLKRTFDELATAYRLHAAILLMRALIATKDVAKAVAIYPPTAPAARVVASAPPRVGVRSGHYDPGKYYIPGSAAYNRLSADEKRANNAMGTALTMPLVMSNYRTTMERYDASMSAMFEPSTSDLEHKLGRYPTMADRKYYTPNTYKSRYG
jgi:hypothetical protein